MTDNNERNKKIFIEYYSTGKSLMDIADEYGIGYQRVHEICKKYLRLMKNKLKNKAECDFQLGIDLICCKNCKYFRTMNYHQWDVCDLFDKAMSEDDFCSKAKPKFDEGEMDNYF